MAAAPRACKVRALGLAVVLALLAPTAVTAQDAQALRARHEALQADLAHSAFPQPLVLQSQDSARASRGDVSAVVAQPFAVVHAVLSTAAAWCDVLMLHQNVKACRVGGAAQRRTVSVAIGRKFDQPAAEAYQVEFAFRPVATGDDYLRVQLSADHGPLGTRDMRIDFEATPAGERATFVHMSYSYRHGALARAALAVYLSTVARDKVGFTVVGRRADGRPVYVGGLRGVVERNALRYYYAVDAVLGASALPQARQPEQRLRAWWALVAQHPRQLREMERDEYLAMKRRELARLQAPER